MGPLKFALEPLSPIVIAWEGDYEVEWKVRVRP